MLAISVQSNDAFKPVADLTVPVMEEYCVRHGYKLLFNHNRPIQRSIVWDRYYIMQEELPGYDWMVHMDADVLITNLSIRLEEFIDAAGHKDIIISRCLTETGQKRFNDGVAFFRNHIRTFDVLAKMLAMPDDDFVRCGQDALERLYLRGQIPTPHFERHKAINAFDYTVYGLPATTIGHWGKGDWVLHMPGMKNKDRISLINEKCMNIIR